MYSNSETADAMNQAIKSVRALVIESRSGGWYVCGVPGKRTVYGPFAAMMRATRQALKHVRRLPHWHVVVLDARGSQLVAYDSAAAVRGRSG